MFIYIFSFLQVIPTPHYSMRSATLGMPNKKDYIEELTKQLDTCQKVGLIVSYGCQTECSEGLREVMLGLAVIHDALKTCNINRTISADVEQVLSQNIGSRLLLEMLK